MSGEKWERSSIGIQNLLEPLLVGLGEMLQHEKDELERKLSNLKRLGVIQLNKQELDRKLEEMKAPT